VLRDGDAGFQKAYGVAGSGTAAYLVRPDGHVAACLQGPASRSDATLRQAVGRALGRSISVDVTVIAS